MALALLLRCGAHTEQPASACIQSPERQPVIIQTAVKERQGIPAAASVCVCRINGMTPSTQRACERFSSACSHRTAPADLILIFCFLCFSSVRVCASGRIFLQMFQTKLSYGHTQQHFSSGFDPYSRLSVIIIIILVSPAMFIFCFIFFIYVFSSHVFFLSTPAAVGLVTVHHRLQ